MKAAKPGARPPKAFIPPPSLRVRRYNPPLQWMVASEEQAGDAEVPPYLVDLGAYGGNGECCCKHFLCRLAPELKAGRRPGPATRCKHIKAARECLLNHYIREHLESQNQPNKGNRPPCPES